MVSLETYNLWRTSFSSQRMTKYSPQDLRALDDTHVTRDRIKLLLREATHRSWANIKYVPVLKNYKFSPHLIVADHLLLSLDPVPRCLDAKLLFNSCCCCKMLSSGWWPFEERGSPALWAEPLRTVLRSWALLLRSLRNWCLNVARASGEKWDSWEDWLFPCRESENKLEKGEKTRVLRAVSLLQWWASYFFFLFLGNQVPLLHWGSKIISPPIPFPTPVDSVAILRRYLPKALVSCWESLWHEKCFHGAQYDLPVKGWRNLSWTLYSGWCYGGTCACLGALKRTENLCVIGRDCLSVGIHNTALISFVSCVCF